MHKKYFIKSIFISFVLFLNILFGIPIVNAQQNTSVKALVPFTGNNYPINVAQDKTEVFEKKYGVHSFQDELVSEGLLLFLELLFFLLLLKIYQIINKKYLKSTNFKFK